MNREIKFRVYIPETDEMINVWEYSGDEYYFKLGENGIIVESLEEIHFEGGGEIDTKFNWKEIESVSIQFTNLLDMCDQRIFDGDIINWYGPMGCERMEVYWRNGSWHFKRFQCEKIRDTVYQDWKNVDTTQIEVIGNIHQNKELLCL